MTHQRKGETSAIGCFLAESFFYLHALIAKVCTNSKNK